MFGTTGGGEADVTSAGNFCHLFAAATTANAAASTAAAAGAVTLNSTTATSFSAIPPVASAPPPPPLVPLCVLKDVNAASSSTTTPSSSSSSAVLNSALLFSSAVNATSGITLPPLAPPPPPPPSTAVAAFSAEAISRLFNELLQKQQELSNQAAALSVGGVSPLNAAMLAQRPAAPLLETQAYQLPAASTLPPPTVRQRAADIPFPLFRFSVEPLNSISATDFAGRPPSAQHQQAPAAYPPPPSYAEALLHEQQEQNRLLLKQMEAISAAASMTTSATVTLTSNHCVAIAQHDQQQQHQRHLLLNNPIMSPDISRLAADTTAVSLTDKSDEAAVAERSTPGCSTATSQGGRADPRTTTCMDETPLDLSTRSKTYSSSSSSCSSGNTHFQPSTSAQSRQNTPPQLLTPPMKGPLRASLKHIKQGQFGVPSCSGGSGTVKSVEVKRSASSVTYRAFDPDVSEHFRRSLSGKWPRRQLNYASYYREGDPHHHHLVDEEEDYYPLSAEARPPQADTSNAAPATSGGESSTPKTPSSPPPPPSSSRLNALFRKSFWRKTSTTSSSSGCGGAAVSPSPDGCVTLAAVAASTTASPSPLSVLDERSAITTDTTDITDTTITTTTTTTTTNDVNVADSPLMMEQECHRVPSHSSVSSPSLGGLLTSSKKLSSSSGTNVMTKIIVNEARQVEDHFRMALGEKTFQLLKRAQQKSTTPTTNSRRLMNGGGAGSETRPTPPPPQSAGGDSSSAGGNAVDDGCGNYANPELFRTPTTTMTAPHQHQQQQPCSGPSGDGKACSSNNGGNEMMCISRL